MGRSLRRASAAPGEERSKRRDGDEDRVEVEGEVEMTDEGRGDSFLLLDGDLKSMSFILRVGLHGKLSSFACRLERAWLWY